MRRLAFAAVFEQGMSVFAAGCISGFRVRTVSVWVNGFRCQGELLLAAWRRVWRVGEQQALLACMRGSSCSQFMVTTWISCVCCSFSVRVRLCVS